MEICDGLGVKTILVTLLSIVITFTLAVLFVCSLFKGKPQQESNIPPPFTNPIQTNFTS